MAALTLVPAIVSLLGKALFWPSKSWKKEPKHGTFIKARQDRRQPSRPDRAGLRWRDGRARRLRAELQPVLRLQLQPAQGRGVDRGDEHLPGALLRGRGRAGAGAGRRQGRHADPGPG
ncbi:hypothetical protein [Nocardioides convexus]|uniref:hypothetical protein n=1 Tax=Nocardioides convexus TaxID=2712224 RepID=UPI00241854DA|nr:hypothetical protein [Nocardioides convexus]